MEHLTTEAFREKIFDYTAERDWKYKGNVPAIIDFYADWCGPCRMVAPVLEALDEEYRGRVNIFKVNTEEESELSSIFDIRSIPSILFIPVVDKPRMSMGAMSRQDFIRMIQDVLKVQ